MLDELKLHHMFRTSSARGDAGNSRGSGTTVANCLRVRVRSSLWLLFEFEFLGVLLLSLCVVSLLYVCVGCVCLGTDVDPSSFMSYESGPLKGYERCREKVESDYMSSNSFPHSARVIDVIRGSFTFQKIKDLIDATRFIMEFANRSGYQQSQDIDTVDKDTQSLIFSLFCLFLCFFGFRKRQRMGV